MRLELDANKFACSVLRENAFLVLLNIIDWTNFYKDSDYFYVVCLEVDIYLFRLLWKWVHKRHPSRSSIWLLKRYWCKKYGKFIFYNFAPTISRSYTLVFHCQ
uniref:Putative reverse transcriptase and intron maturase n=1 Tax=Eutreptiella pomquetensis TaxID=215699 RepID=A0A223FMH2_9EUGL|nr:putative reverse transcriptase and intron maturase [Eutreptiella pomquetensis]